MNPPDYEVDPDGDVVLVLQSPNAPFAVWAANEDPLVPAPSKLLARPNSKARRKARRNILAYRSLGQDVVEPPGPVEPESGLEAPAEPPASTDESPPADEPPPESDHPNDGPPAPDNDTHTNCSVEQGEVRIRLSSKHLTLASPVFKRMLQGPWRESTVSSGYQTLDASEWDVEMTLVLMNVLHSRVRSVPRTISLEMLAKIAVLVDYYECHEALELFVDIWIEELGRDLPTEYCRDLVLWLAISWVFSKDTLFKAITKVALMESSGPLQTLNLPIPQRIVAHIDQERQKTVKKIISGLHMLLLHLYEKTECSSACSSMLGGALARQMHAHHFLNPRPAKPFARYSIAGTTAIVRKFTSPTWSSSDSYLEHTCSLAALMGPTVIGFADGIVGLELKMFQRVTG